MYFKPVLFSIAMSSAALALGACGADESSDDSPSQGADAWSEPEYAADAAARPWEESDAGEAESTEDAISWADTGSEDDVGPGEDAGESLPEIVENDWIETADDNLATFSIDVDTASYTMARNTILGGALPDPYTVRTEEFINFFDYGYRSPKYGEEAPFTIETEAAPSWFGEDANLLMVGIQAAAVDPQDRLPANLVFLVDTSGSMSTREGLPLVKDSLRALLEYLNENDTVSLVTYAGTARTALPPTPVSSKTTILAAIEHLESGGSTGGEGGIRAAYDLAEEAMVPGGVNRVILCTDGDFNVGLTGEALWDMIAEFRSRNIYLTGMLFGQSTYGDTTMEHLTNLGNGNYYSIPDINSANALFSENFVGILQVVAKDVKIQVELNPDVVARYRLVGYDNRVLEDWEFEDDTRDAGEVGAGQTVTAFIEFELHEGLESVDPTTLIGGVDVRYKPMDSETSVLIESTFALAALRPSFDEATAGFRWAAAVTELAEILKESMHTDGSRFDEIEAIASPLTGGDPDRETFIDVARAAQALWP
jgi:Ca-activated chloride channel family protein